MLWLKGVLTVAFAQNYTGSGKCPLSHSLHTRAWLRTRKKGRSGGVPPCPAPQEHRTKAAGPAEKLRNRLREPSLCSAICRPLCGEPIVSLLCPILSKGFGH